MLIMVTWHLINKQQQLISVAKQYNINNFIITKPSIHPLLSSTNNNSNKMTTFGQSTIHSKLAKFEKTQDDTNTGHVVKGVNSDYGINRTINKKYWTTAGENKADIMREIQILPKSKLNVTRKIKNKTIIPGIKRNQQIVLMESSVFPAIYFKKTALRNVLKQFSFPNNCCQLSSDDMKTALLYQIISNLFSEINFHIFNIMVGQNMQNNSYYIFFSDSQTLPFTKCCNAPVFLQLQQNGSGKILCNSTNCKHPNLAQFLINFDDGRKLWPNVPYFAQASYKDKQLKSKISKLIINGKYKRQSLVGMVQDTSKEIVGLFYQSKKMSKNINNNDQSITGNINDQNTFVTGTGIGGYEQQAQLSRISRKQNNQPIEDPEHDEQDQRALIEEQDNNMETLKMKLKYVTKKQTNIHKRLSKSIVQESKIFEHNFDIIRRIDEQLLKNRNTKVSSKITFPQLMSQIQRADRTKRQSIQNKTFTH